MPEEKQFNANDEKVSKSPVRKRQTRKPRKTVNKQKSVPDVKENQVVAESVEDQENTEDVEKRYFNFRLEDGYRWNFIQSAGMEFTKDNIITLYKGDPVLAEIMKNPHIIQVD